MPERSFAVAGACALCHALWRNSRGSDDVDVREPVGLVGRSVGSRLLVLELPANKLFASSIVTMSHYREG